MFERGPKERIETGEMPVIGRVQAAPEKGWVAGRNLTIFKSLVLAILVAITFYGILNRGIFSAELWLPVAVAMLGLVFITLFIVPRRVCPGGRLALIAEARGTFYRRHEPRSGGGRGARRAAQDEPGRVPGQQQGWGQGRLDGGVPEHRCGGSGDGNSSGARAHDPVKKPLFAGAVRCFYPRTGRNPVHHVLTRGHGRAGDGVGRALRRGRETAADVHEPAPRPRAASLAGMERAGLGDLLRVRLRREPSGRRRFCLPDRPRDRCPRRVCAPAGLRLSRGALRAGPGPAEGARDRRCGRGPRRDGVRGLRGARRATGLGRHTGGFYSRCRECGGRARSAHLYRPELPGDLLAGGVGGVEGASPDGYWGRHLLVYLAGEPPRLRWVEASSQRLPGAGNGDGRRGFSRAYRLRHDPDRVRGVGCTTSHRRAEGAARGAYGGGGRVPRLLGARVALVQTGFDNLLLCHGGRDS